MLRGNGDNPFVTVDPDGSFDYAHRIRADHPPGTYWYTRITTAPSPTRSSPAWPGRCWSTAVDPDLPVTDDLALLVTDTTLDGAGWVAAPNMMARTMGREGDLVLVNGQHQPVITAAPGDAQRWRVINGCVSGCSRCGWRATG